MLGIFNRSHFTFTNYGILLSSSAIISLGMGLWGPYWVVFIQDFGSSVESLGFAVGLMVLAQSLTAYFAGRFSDRFGRKPLIVASSVVSAVLIFGYTLITSILQLYALQILFGIFSAVGSTAESAFWGDITKRKTRGRDIGRRDATLGIVAGLALMGGGKLAGEFGVEVIFYLVAGFFLLSSLVLLLIREPR